MRNVIVFHSPAPLQQDANRGSTLRPVQMHRAFEELGYKILLVDGFSQDRKKKWQEVEKAQSSIIGLYSELRSIPTALTDPDHLPRHPLMDIAYFRSLRKSGIPTTAFYRDIYWRFPLYSQELSWYKRWPTKLFFFIELLTLKRYLTHIFVPSISMLDHFPIALANDQFSALPPGGYIQDLRSRQDYSELQLLYVGGVLPPLYDLTAMLQAVQRTPGVHLMLCCRKEEWNVVKTHYGHLERVSVTHNSTESLHELFSRADALLMYRKMHPYLRFAMPVKLFEAMGYGIPIITNAQCEMGNLVSTSEIGWSLNSELELVKLLGTLRDNRSILANTKEMVKKVRHKHSWIARAQQVVDVLQRCQLD